MAYRAGFRRVSTADNAYLLRGVRWLYGKRVVVGLLGWWWEMSVYCGVVKCSQTAWLSHLRGFVFELVGDGVKYRQIAIPGDFDSF